MQSSQQGDIGQRGQIVRFGEWEHQEVTVRVQFVMGLQGVCGGQGMILGKC